MARIKAVTLDLRELIQFGNNLPKGFRNVGTKAAVDTINELLFTAREPQAEEMERVFDNPAPFTKKAWAVQKATYTSAIKGQKVMGYLNVKDKQADYLQWQIHGGVKLPKKRRNVIGKGIRKNKYGNMGKDVVSKLYARMRSERRVSYGYFHDPETNQKAFGIVEYRTKRASSRFGKLKGLIRLVYNLRYKKIYDPFEPFVKHVRRNATRVAADKFRREYSYQLGRIHGKRR